MSEEDDQIKRIRGEKKVETSGQLGPAKRQQLQQKKLCVCYCMFDILRNICISLPICSICAYMILYEYLYVYDHVCVLFWYCRVLISKRGSYPPLKKGSSIVNWRQSTSGFLGGFLL